MKPVETATKWSRRDVLKSASAAGLALAGPALAGPLNLTSSRARRCIFILCTGGPSQLETWDPKPEAVAEVRGPYGAIETSVPGIRISEVLPRLAQQAHRYTLVRGVGYEGPAVHEVGMQLIQTGEADMRGAGSPHVGAVYSHLDKAAVTGSVLLPHALRDTGIPLSQGQGAGFLAAELAPRSAASPELLAPSTRAALDLSGERDSLRERYGRTGFGDDCLRARRLVESGTRFVTVNQFTRLFHQHSWDCHGYPDLPTRVADLRDQVATPFDLAVSALIQDLCDRGLYEDTLIVCAGEFGRTPTINSTGGRDHWTRCWSVMLGGGGLRGGQVVGGSDSQAAEALSDPISPATLVATIYRALGVAPESVLTASDGSRHALPTHRSAPLSV